MEGCTHNDFTLNTSSSFTKLKNKILNPMSSFFQLAGNCDLYGGGGGGGGEQNKSFVVYNRASIPWVINVNNFQFLVRSQKLCNLQICIIYN